MVSTQQVHQDSEKVMSVNVALCGSIPRASLTKGQGAPCRLAPSLSKDSLPDGSRCGNLNLTLASERLSTQAPHNNENMRPVLTDRQPLAQVFDAPSWAVPAPGEARLEVCSESELPGSNRKELFSPHLSLLLQPVCEVYGRQRPVDLTAKPFFRIGRSPHCDVQLIHQTSSRRHAMLFHHSNGGCYIVDCGSAHGTFVNGVRISSPSNGGVVVPHKVRRGALIRFGGPGAPCFVLKSFSFKLKEVINHDETQPDMGELVRRNTRLNALGKSAADTVRDRLKMALTDVLTVSRKRSFDSLATSVTLDEDYDEPPSSKRIRCESPPLSPEVPLRLVSPDYVCPKSRRVTFAPEVQYNYPATISPTDSEDESSI